VDVPVRKTCRSPLGIRGALTRVDLAPIEKKVVRMLAHGASPRIIAERLALSESSLRACLDSVFAKLAISGQLGLLAGPESRDHRSSFSFIRKAHRLAVPRKNPDREPDRENDMQVA
jgi:DNA-binding CsgD family transcriptional regulator